MKVLNYLMAFGAAVLLACCVTPENGTPDGGESKAEISATPSKVVFSGDGETINVAVSVKGSDTWEYRGKPDWVSVKVEGNSMALTADANTTGAERSGAIELIAGEASAMLEITQAKGAKYPGYTELETSAIEFAGTMYQQFGYPDCEGSLFVITLESSDERKALNLLLFNEAYESEEEVVLAEGKYVPGDDYVSAMMHETEFKGTPMTWIKGGSFVFSDEEGDEEFSGGTTLTVTTGELEEEYLMNEGSIEISYPEEGVICIKCDFKDTEGAEHKYYYEGSFELLLDGAFYPSEGTALLGGMLTYEGDDEKGEHSNFSLLLMTSDYTMSNIAFVTPKTDATELKVSGVYTIEEGNMAPGEIQVIEEEGETYEMPSGSYWAVNFDEIHAASTGSMFMLLPNEDGTWNVVVALVDKEGAEYSLKFEAAELEVYDGTAEDWEEY